MMPLERSAAVALFRLAADGYGMATIRNGQRSRAWRAVETVIHEGGHAAAAHAFGVSDVTVSMDLDDPEFGGTCRAVGISNLDERRMRIFGLAGAAAHQYAIHGIRWHDSIAASRAREHVSSRDELFAKSYSDRDIRESLQVVRANWKAVTSIAWDLLTANNWAWTRSESSSLPKRDPGTPAEASFELLQSPQRDDQNSDDIELVIFAPDRQGQMSKFDFNSWKRASALNHGVSAAFDLR